MTAKGNKPPLALDMPFAEALARFAQTDLKEAKEREEKKSESRKRDAKG